MSALIFAAWPLVFAQASAKQEQIANAVVPQMAQAGLIRVDAEARKAWVDTAFW